MIQYGEWGAEMQFMLKRIFDLFVSLIGLLVLSPLFLLIAIAIKIDSRGPVIFKQVRGGYQGRHFKIYKFRTMCVNAENKGMGYKTKNNDPRITKVGSFLRKTSIDELPQLINVLKGDMSIVGPRPALPVHTDNYDDHQRQRLKVKPGITGYAQIKGRNELSWDEKIEFDIFYVKNFSLWLDLKIIIKTLFVIFKFNGIYVKSETELSEENSYAKRG